MQVIWRISCSFQGEKVFYFVDPTEENFKQYEKWVSSVRQSEVFFGDMVKNCYKCVVKPGQTMFIPTGTLIYFIIYGWLYEWARWSKSSALIGYQQCTCAVKINGAILTDNRMARSVPARKLFIDTGSKSFSFVICTNKNTFWVNLKIFTSLSINGVQKQTK